MRKIEFKRLDHVQICIPVGQEQAARDFYGSVLGLSEIDKPEALKKNGGLWFGIADIQLHIGTEDEKKGAKRHPAFEVAGLDAVREYLAEKVEIRDEIPIPGVKRFSFFDPFGNRIELLEKLEGDGL